ncbi:MAG: hypothetical protein ACRDOM_05035, partial [Nocardioides sp.]
MPVVSRQTNLSDDLRRAMLLVREGRVAHALKTLAQMPVPQEPLAIVTRLATVLECRLARGELSQARRMEGELRSFADHSGAVGATALLALGELATCSGDPTEAAQRYTDAGRVLGPALDDPEHLPWRVGAALALAHLGDRGEADRLAEEHLVLARRGGSPYA